MKTAYELAMEKLRRKDAERGESASRLTDAQKAEIAEIRKVYGARRAEREILHKAELRKARARGDADALAKMEEDYRRDLQRIDDEMEEKVAAVRRKN
jgi:hypothetical protein